MRLHHVLGKVHAVDGPVPPNVLPVIGELKRRADRVRQLEQSGVPAAVQMEDQPADRIRGEAAVLKQLGIGAIPAYGLILHECLDQVFEAGGRKFVPGQGVGERHKHRMVCPPLEDASKLGPPPAQQFQALRRVSGLVTQVVGPPAERVDVAVVLTQALWNQETCDKKVSVVPAREPSGVAGRIL